MHTWLSEVFNSPDLLGVLGIVAKTTAVYVFVIVGLRVLGTRELGQMSLYDFVLIVVIANSVQNAMVGGNDTLVAGLVSALTLMFWNGVLSCVLDRFPKLQHAMVGEPIVLLSDGLPRWDKMRKTGVTRDELIAGLREHGVASLDDVRLAVLETDGSISVVPKEARVHRARRRIRGLTTT